MEWYTRNCTNAAKPVAHGAPVSRSLVTPRVRFDPTAGDRLVCQLTCPTPCTGTVEIWDLESLARGENPGVRQYSVEVTPSNRGSAYCRFDSTNPGGALVLNLMRGSTVVASAPAK